METSLAVPLGATQGRAKRTDHRSSDRCFEAVSTRALGTLALEALVLVGTVAYLRKQTRL
jgi:hypothetical protein